MSYRLLGLHIRPPSVKRPETKTFAPPLNTEGAVVVNDVGGSNLSGYFAAGLDLTTSLIDEVALINRYRDMALYPETDDAINDIVNETIIRDEDKPIVSLNLNQLPKKYNTEKIRQAISSEFDYVMRLLDFNDRGYETFRQWYVDGRLYYHMIIDEKNPQDGIQELRLIDSRCMKFVREVRRTLDLDTASPLVNVTNEYFIYCPMGLQMLPQILSTPGSMSLATKIAKDSIFYIHSGLYDPTHNQILSYLHKAIKPLNQLRMMEDSSVIYRLARAPERRIFYVDVGQLPAKQAETYVQNIVQQYRNKMIYDSKTGEIKDDRNFMTMLEDFFLPRREGGRGTEVSNLQGGQNLGQIEDIDYFKKKLYKALNVPYSRTEQTTGYSLGRATEITRDEIKFARFLGRLRSRFSDLFDQVMSRHLFLKKIIPNPRVWADIRHDVQYDWQTDSYYAELKDIEIKKERVALLSSMDMYKGRYFSDQYFMSDVLKFSDNEIEDMKNQIDQENKMAPANQMNQDDSGSSPFGGGKPPFGRKPFGKHQFPPKATPQQGAEKGKATFEQSPKKTDTEAKESTES